MPQPAFRLTRAAARLLKSHRCIMRARFGLKVSTRSNLDLHGLTQFLTAQLVYTAIAVVLWADIGISPKRRPGLRCKVNREWDRSKLSTDWSG